eukprot:1075340-Pyramimonas_sp.AAC.1
MVDSSSYLEPADHALHAQSLEASDSRDSERREWAYKGQGAEAAESKSENDDVAGVAVAVVP